MRRERLAGARKAAGKTQEQVAEEVGVDRTTIGTWERGEYTPRPDQRPAYADALRLSLTELDGLLSTMPTNDDEVPDWASTYLAMEQSAIEMRAHEPAVVYGLLQIPAYTEAVVRRLGVSGASDTYVQRAVEQRRHRQQRVRDGSLTLDVIQVEQTLRVRIGDAGIVADQLAALAEFAELSNVTVRVMPFDAGQYEARRMDTFAIMAHPWGNPRVWIEGYGGGQFITDADEVAYFAAAYDLAANLALSPAESVAFIRKLGTEWEARR